MRVAGVLSEGFEDSEFRQPYDALRQGGHEVTILGNEAGAQLKGKAGKVTATVDTTLETVAPDQFEALLIPGGYSPDHLRAEAKWVDFVKAFFALDRPVFAVCHGPQLMISAEVVKGRRMTAWRTIQDDLRQIPGVTVVDEEVVVDGNLVTSRQPDDLDAFVRESLALLDRVPAGSR